MSHKRRYFSTSFVVFMYLCLLLFIPISGENSSQFLRSIGSGVVKLLLPTCEDLKCVDHESKLYVTDRPELVGEMQSCPNVKHWCQKKAETVFNVGRSRGYLSQLTGIASYRRKLFQIRENMAGPLMHFFDKSMRNLVGQLETHVGSRRYDVRTPILQFHTDIAPLLKIQEHKRLRSLGQSIKTLFIRLTPAAITRELLKFTGLDSLAIGRCVLTGSVVYNNLDLFNLTSIIKPLKKSIADWRSMVKLADSALELLSVLEDEDIHDNCVTALSRMSLCPICAGHTSHLACPGLCFNVLHGCLAQMRSDMEVPLSCVVKALRQLHKESNKVVKNLTRALHPDRFLEVFRGGVTKMKKRGVQSKVSQQPYPILFMCLEISKSSIN